MNGPIYCQVGEVKAEHDIDNEKLFKSKYMNSYETVNRADEAVD